MSDGLRLVCRHLREQGPESWGFYLNGPLPDPLGLVPSAIIQGEAPLAVLTAPEAFGEDNPEATDDTATFPLDGVIHYRLEVWSPQAGAEGTLESRRFLPFDFVVPTEHVLEQARSRVVLLVNLLAARHQGMDDAGAGHG